MNDSYIFLYGSYGLSYHYNSNFCDIFGKFCGNIVGNTTQPYHVMCVCVRAVCVCTHLVCVSACVMYCV